MRRPRRLGINPYIFTGPCLWLNTAGGFGLTAVAVRVGGEVYLNRNGVVTREVVRRFERTSYYNGDVVFVLELK